MSSTPESTAIALVDPSKAIALDPRRVALSLDPFEPQTMPELFKFAQVVAVTDFCPKEFRGKPDDCFVAMVYGRGLGIGALQSIQGIGVINGKPSTYGELFWAIIISHPEFVDCEEVVTDDGAKITITRKGRKPYVAEFTKADAVVAGLWGKTGPWTNYPKGQLLWRARHRGATAVFADALKGILPREVALDYVIEGEVMTRPAEKVEAMRQEGETAQRQLEESSATVSAEQVKELTDTYKASGYKANDVRDKMKDLYGDKVDRTGLIPANRFPEILAWAKVKKGDAAPAPAAAKPAEPETPFDDPKEVTPDEKNSRQAFGLLGLNLFDQARWIDRFTSDGVTNWTALFKEVGKELPE